MRKTTTIRDCCPVFAFRSSEYSTELHALSWLSISFAKGCLPFHINTPHISTPSSSCSLQHIPSNLYCYNCRAFFLSRSLTLDPPTHHSYLNTPPHINQQWILTGAPSANSTSHSLGSRVFTVLIDAKRRMPWLHTLLLAMPTLPTCNPSLAKRTRPTLPCLRPPWPHRQTPTHRRLLRP